ncbi:hypothetical protein MYX76_00890 [Desulfobacterota bacterium AH_259_B03_O07]|nr:hypothetical protein [Desulfobacterota bacterium AH_259_B03_O07]
MSNSKYIIKIDPTKEDKYEIEIYCKRCNEPFDLPLNISTTDNLEQILHIIKLKMNHLKCPNCEINKIDDYLS